MRSQICRRCSRAGAARRRWCCRRCARDCRAWRLAGVRRLSAHRAVRAGAGLLQRRQRKVRQRRRFCHRAGAVRLFGRCVARQCAQVLQLSRRRCAGTGRRQWRAGRRCAADAAGARRSCRSTITSWRSAPTCAGASSSAGRAAGGAARARAVAGRAARSADRRRDSGERSGRCAAVQALRDRADALLERGVALSAQGEADRGRSARGRATARRGGAYCRVASAWGRRRREPLAGATSPSCVRCCSRGSRARRSTGPRRAAADRLWIGRREYYHPQRGTARCAAISGIARTIDALLYPGLQDISAWVDFTRVAEAAVDAALEVGATAPRRRSCWRTGSRRMSRPGAATAQRAAGASSRRERCCCPERWGRISRSWRSRAASMRRCAASSIRTCGARFEAASSRCRRAAR
jgi:hypothetical protein